MSTAKQVDPAVAAELFIFQDQIHEPMHDRFLWATMQRRHAEAAAIPEWEELREIASKIKEHALTHLDHYLEEFEANATKRGAQVHWALDGADHNNIVYSILQDHGVKELIKSKSMLQEECQMTPFLQQRGIKVVESDLGERIQQLDGQPPSHGRPGDAPGGAQDLGPGGEEPLDAQAARDLFRPRRRGDHGNRRPRGLRPERARTRSGR